MLGAKLGSNYVPQFVKNYTDTWLTQVEAQVMSIYSSCISIFHIALGSHLHDSPGVPICHVIFKLFNQMNIL